MVILFILLIILSPVNTYAQEYEPSIDKEITEIEEKSANSPITMDFDSFLDKMMDEKGSYQTLDYGQVFDLMKNSVNSGETINLSEALSLKGLTIPENMMFDLSECGISGTLDPELLNYEYADMVTGMDEKLNAIDLSENSNNVIDSFKNEFGDIGTSPDNYEIPKDFSIQKMTKSQNNSINKAYKEAFKTNDYKNIRKSIDVSSIFKEANKGVKESDLKKTESDKEYYEETKNKSKQKSYDEIYGENGYLDKKQKKEKEALEHLNPDVDGAAENYEKYIHLFED